MTKNTQVPLHQTDESRETITVSMSKALERLFHQEMDLCEIHLKAGHPNPEIEAHLDVVIGPKDNQPSPTPKINPDFRP